MEDEDLEMENEAEDTGVFGMGTTDPQAALASLSQRYMGLLGQQQAARQKAEATRAARFKAAEEAIKQQRFGAPTTSQQLAALSQALLSPRRQRGIAGTFANLAPVFGQMATLQTSAEEKRAEALRQLREQYEVAGEESRLAGLESKREAIEPLIRTYGTLAKPRVGRIVGTETIDGIPHQGEQDPVTGVVRWTPINPDAQGAALPQLTAPQRNALSQLREYISNPNVPEAQRQSALRNFQTKFKVDPLNYLKGAM